MITTIFSLLFIYAVAASLILGSKAASKKFPRFTPVFSRIRVIGFGVAALGGLFTVALAAKGMKG